MISGFENDGYILPKINALDVSEARRGDATLCSKATARTSLMFGVPLTLAGKLDLGVWQRHALNSRGVGSTFLFCGNNRPKSRE